MRLLKLLIPKDKAQTIQELESWTISWKVQTDMIFGRAKTFNKVFVNEREADEFKKQLEQSAKFLKTVIETSKTKN